MRPFHLAQLNIGIPRGPLDGAVMQEFMDALDPVNAVADVAPGFIWRLQTDDGNATALHAFEDDRLIVNMSVWESLEALRAFSGEDTGIAVVEPEARRLLVNFDERVTLYDVVLDSTDPGHMAGDRDEF